MQLVADETIITVEGVTFVLRPTLRAAFRLERKYGGFEKLINAMLTGNVEALIDLITESSTDKAAAYLRVSKLLGKIALNHFIDETIDGLSVHLGNLMGVSDEQDEQATQSAATSKPMPFAEYHTRLFKIATGWLGWTPEDAWNATPAEISIAFEGYIERHKFVHGVKEEKPEQTEYVPHFDRDPDVRERLLRPSSADRKRAERRKVR